MYTINETTNRAVIDFKVVQAINANGLGFRIGQLLKEGYELYGPTFFGGEGNGICQAVVLRVKEQQSI